MLVFREQYSLLYSFVLDSHCEAFSGWLGLVGLRVYYSIYPYVGLEWSFLVYSIWERKCWVQ